MFAQILSFLLRDSILLLHLARLADRVHAGEHVWLGRLPHIFLLILADSSFREAPDRCLVELKHREALASVRVEARRFRVDLVDDLRLLLLAYPNMSAFSI